VRDELEEHVRDENSDGIFANYVLRRR